LAGGLPRNLIDHSCLFLLAGLLKNVSPLDNLVGRLIDHRLKKGYVQGIEMGNSAGKAQRQVRVDGDLLRNALGKGRQSSD